MVPQQYRSGIGGSCSRIAPFSTRRPLAIEILGPDAIGRMRAAGRCAAATLAHVGARLRAGITTADIDAWVRADTKARGAQPSQLGYNGFPASVCDHSNDRTAPYTSKLSRYSRATAQR